MLIIKHCFYMLNKSGHVIHIIFLFVGPRISVTLYHIRKFTIILHIFHILSKRDLIYRISSLLFSLIYLSQSRVTALMYKYVRVCRNSDINEGFSTTVKRRTRSVGVRARSPECTGCRVLLIYKYTDSQLS